MVLFGLVGVNLFHESDQMAMIRLLGRGTVVACAVSSALSGCSSVEPDQKLAASQRPSSAVSQANGTVQTVSPDGQLAIEYRNGQPSQNHPQVAAQPGNPQLIGPQIATAQTVPGVPGSQPTVAVAKTARLPVPVPASADVATVQTAAMAAPAMAPLVAMTQTTQAPASAAAPAPVPAAAQPKVSTVVAAFPPVPAAPWTTPATSTILASSRQETSTTAKVGRIVSPGVAPAVAEGRIQPAAAQAIALDEKEPTPDMVALQSVVPIPRPDIATITAPSVIRPTLTPTVAGRQAAASETTLAYASAPRPMAALSAVEFPPAPGEPMPLTASEAPPEISKLIHRYAGMYGVPESLVHRVVHRESKYDPKAYHKNGYWGLMQIKYSTAKSMGYSGPPAGLLDAETNLKYAIKYLRGAWLVADNKNDNAIRLYARGYYYDAKQKDMLHVLEK